MTGSTFLGMKVYKTNFLKVYFPFMLSGSTMFFAMSYVHTKLMDDPNDKWARNVQTARENGELQKLKNEAASYLEKIAKGGEPKKADAHHH